MEEMKKHVEEITCAKSKECLSKELQEVQRCKEKCEV